MEAEIARLAAKALRECADGCEEKIREHADVEFTAADIIETMRGTADLIEIRHGDFSADDAK